MNRVAIVVLNFKGIEDTLICVESLLEQTYSSFKIIVIENGSDDGSGAEIKKLEQQHGDKLIAIYNIDNRGFAGGVNIGINWALENNFDYIALFNNDAVADKLWLETLVNTAVEKQSAITTGLLLHEHGNTIDSTGDWYSTWGLPFPRNRGDTTSTAPKAGYVFSASGGASLYKASLFKDVGVFDESFFAYYEDTDVSFRTLLAGYRIYYTPIAIAYHKQGGTSSKLPGFTVYQTFKNLPLLFIKNVPSGLLFRIGIRFWLAYILMLGHAIVRGSGVPAIKGAFKGAVLFWTTALPARRHIQKTKAVNAQYIDSMLWKDLPPDQTGLRKLRDVFSSNATKN